MCKNTYGTGCLVLMNTGESPVHSTHNLITTIGWRVDGKPVYALEGSVLVGGAVVQWLRDELKLVKTAAETEPVAMEAPDNGGVYFVPAFTGLGAPHWDMYGRGAILGLTRGANRAHIVRSALESIAYQSVDVIEAMESDAGIATAALRVDGGASANNFLMQFQADVMNAQVIRPTVIETTAMGAAMLAGRAVGLWTDSDLKGLQSVDREFTPAMDEKQRNALLHHWHRAVERSKGWAEGNEE
jgi:glycerol kinase